MDDRDQAPEVPDKTPAGDYVGLLDAFGAAERTPQECALYLQRSGFSAGQARNAVYRYRQQRGLLRKRAEVDESRAAE